jgi:hypothetical protein
MADSARAVLRKQMEEFGLGTLADWAWQRYLELGEGSEDQIMLEMRQRPEYKQRFPAMDQLSKEGRAIPEAEYIAYEKDVREIVQAYGLPAGVWDSAEAIAKGIVNNVSASEVKSRADIAAASQYTAPPEVRSALQQMYGLSGGDLTAYWLNPDNALPVLEKQYAAARIGAEATMRGLGQVSTGTAERMVEAGITAEQARQGLSSTSRELAVALPGEDNALGVDNVALGAVGVGEAGEALRRRRNLRGAVFAQGGGFAAGAEGVSGLGSSSR